jgi:hypothetical protein
MNRLPPLERHPGFDLIRVSGGPYALGFQHGRLVRDGVRRLREIFYRDVVYARGRAYGLALQAVMAPMLLLMQRYIPRALRLEMRGVAAGAGVRYWDILTFNCFDDLLHGLWLIPMAASKLPFLRQRLACSSYVLLAGRTTSGRLLHGRNLDYQVVDYLDAEGAVVRALMDNVIVVEARPDRGHSYLSVTWPGVIGVVTSLNEAGLSLACLTSTVSGETPNGVPLPMLYRQVTQHASTLAEAEQLIRQAKLTIGNNLVVASAPEDDARAFELSPHGVVSRRPQDGVLTATNHFVHEQMAARQNGWVVPNSLNRYRRLAALCGGEACGPEQAASFLRDSISLAEDGDPWSGLENPGTIYSTVAEPASGRLWLRTNDQPERQFIELTAPWAGRPLLATG